MKTLLKFYDGNDFRFERKWDEVPREGDRISLDVIEGDKIVSIRDFRVKEVIWRHDIPNKKKMWVEVKLEEIK